MQIDLTTNELAALTAMVDAENLTTGGVLTPEGWVKRDLLTRVRQRTVAYTLKAIQTMPSKISLRWWRR